MKPAPACRSITAAIWRKLQHAGRSWFHLTRQERLATMIVLGIFLIGAATRWWLGR